MSSKLSIIEDEVHYNTGYGGDMTRDAFIKQQAVCIIMCCSCVIWLMCLQNGVPFANAVANVAFNKDGKVASFGSSFVDTCRLIDPFYISCADATFSSCHRVFRANCFR